MRTLPVAVAAPLVISLMAGLAPRAATAQPAAPLRIQNITLQPDAGVISIGGTGLGPDLVVLVDGQLATVLPGASATQLEVAAPATILTTPGTYRVSVVDPVRQIGDAFVVASQAPVDLVGATVSGNAGAAPGAGPTRGESAAAGSGALTAGLYTGAPSPLTVIEDSGSPYRTAIGYRALFSNTTTGLYNTASGYQALYSNIGGTYNTASGSYALYSNTTGNANTANGFSALYTNTTGSDNTATGRRALYSTTTGIGNTASGNHALFSNTTGTANTANGHSALYSNTTGMLNTAVGVSALSANAAGNSNVAVGYDAGRLATGSYNLFLGAEVEGQPADTNTIRIGLPYDGGSGVGQNRTFIAGIRGTQLTGSAVQVFIDTDGQLGTLTPPIATGTISVPVSQLQQQLTAQRQRLEQQQATIAAQRQRLEQQQTSIADLRARLARLEALAGKAMFVK